jgi:hypothetical protein
MIQVISYQLRKTAEFLIFAAGLNHESLMHAVESLKDILKDQNNFNPEGEIPLTFSKKGLNRVKSIDPALAATTMAGVINRIDRAVSISDDESLSAVQKYLGTLKSRPGRWTNLALKDGMSFEDAKQKVLEDALNLLELADTNLVYKREPAENVAPSPFDNKEDYYRWKKDQKRPVEVGPGKDFDPHRRPAPIKPEKTVERGVSP